MSSAPPSSPSRVPPPAQAPRSEPAGRALQVPVAGMTCAACVRRVERALAKMDGVASVDVNLATEQARIVPGSGRVTDDASRAAFLDEVRATVRARGYEVPDEEVTFGVEGMTCAACAGKVERAVRAVDGVVQAHVEPVTARLRVRRLQGLASDEAVVAAARAAGYAVQREGASSDDDPAERELARQRRALVVAWVFAFPLLVFGMVPMMIPAVHHAVAERVGEWNWHFALFLLATPIQFGPGLRFLRLGARALWHREPDMNTLVAVGTTVAWTWSTLVLFAPGLLPPGEHPVWFEASGLVVAILLFGKYLETLARGAAGRAIGALLDLRPERARVEREDGAVEEIAASALAPGDVLVIRPGERVAADATVASGRAWADESMLTGESREVEKAEGDEVVCGTIVVSGSVRAEVRSVGADTRLSQIVRLVESAQADRPRVQRVADRVVGVFVPVVFAVAALTFAAWYALGTLDDAVLRSVAVLVIACPCAMGLAVPVSVLVGTGRGAQLGVLFRRGEVIETLAGVGHVAFDKTGTLTEGRPELVDVHALVPDDEGRLLAWAAAVERDSEHPLGRAIVRAAEERSADVVEAGEFASEAGRGVSARVDGREVRVGSARWLDVDPEVRATAEARHPTASRVWVSADGALVGSLAVADAIRPGSRAAIEQLGRLHVGVSMITGDGQEVARHVAASLGIDADAVHAEVLPSDKARVVRAIRAEHGRAVAFVGDGVNDAPALATADVGVAVGTGTDVALETGDVVLMTGDPRAMARAIGLSRAVLSNIRWNLVWAFGYNVLLIPVAAGALVWLHPEAALSPVMAGAAMALSSVFVVGNALRLRRWGGGE